MAVPAGFADILALQGVWLGGRRRVSPPVDLLDGSGPDGKREAVRDLLERFRRAQAEDDAVVLALILSVS